MSTRRRCRVLPFVFPREEIARSAAPHRRKPFLSQYSRTQFSMVFIVFGSNDRSQQIRMLQSWEPCVNALRRAYPEQQVGVFELFVYDRGPVWILQRVKSMVDSYRIRDQSRRARVVPLYVDKQSFMKELDIRSDQLVYAMLIERDTNNIIYRASGYFSHPKLSILVRNIERAQHAGRPVLATTMSTALPVAATTSTTTMASQQQVDRDSGDHHAHHKRPRLMRRLPARGRRPHAEGQQQQQQQQQQEEGRQTKRRAFAADMRIQITSRR